MPENGRRGGQWNDHRPLVNGMVWRLKTGNLIGMNEGFVEFCPDQDPPTRAELKALAWLINPTANRPLVKAGANRYFVKLIRERYKSG